MEGKSSITSYIHGGRSELTRPQRSKEKNIIMEETRRRNEASMARKRLNTKGVNHASTTANNSSDGAMSPSSTGAMDSLLEKLRAAAPQARDQRDRRRRARLKDRHQIRVASGQKIPDLGDLTRGSEDEDGEKTVLSPERASSGDFAADQASEMAAISEGEDVAERAASMLQGLRGDTEAEGRPASRDGSMRVRRRGESVDDDKRTRRRRRAGGPSSVAGSEDRDSLMATPVQPDPDSIPEETFSVTTPTTVVSPPSPESEQKKAVEVSP